jgi:hypothetical protein
MTERARAAIGSEAIEAVADRGCYNGEEILAYEEAGIAVYLPKPITSGVNAKGRFGKQDFLEAVQARLDRNPDSVCDARMPPDCRAPLRHDKSWMGRDALPDEIVQDASSKWRSTSSSTT